MESGAETDEKELKTYEVGYLLSPLIPEDKVADLVNSNIRQAIETNQGSIISEVLPRLRPLAYPVAKTASGRRESHRDAYFGAVRFKLPPAATSEIKEKFTKTPEIIRFLIIISPDEPARAIPRRPARERKTALPANPVGAKAVMTAEEIDKEIEGLLAKP